MSRGLWFVAGAGAGIYAMVRGRRAAEAFTADGLKDRAGAAGVGLRMFRDEVAQGKAEAETDLRQRLGLVPHGTPELNTGPGGFEARSARTSTTEAEARSARTSTTEAEARSARTSTTEPNERGSS